MALVVVCVVVGACAWGAYAVVRNHRDEYEVVAIAAVLFMDETERVQNFVSHLAGAAARGDPHRLLAAHSADI